jgi:hypothetical protein
VTGKSAGDWNRHGDVLTIKYTAAGTMEWVDRYQGQSPYTSNGGSDLLVSSDGTLFVAAYLDITGDAHPGIVMLRYSPSGDLLGITPHIDTTSFDEIPVALAIDGEGDIYLTGWIPRQWNIADLVVIKYGGNGDEVWSSLFNLPDSAEVKPVDIVVAAKGDIFVTARSERIDIPSPPVGDILTISYSSAGTLRWVRTYDRTEANNPLPDDHERPTSLCVDPEGQVYVTGVSSNRYDVSPLPKVGESLLTISRPLRKCVSCRAGSQWMVRGMS